MKTTLLSFLLILVAPGVSKAEMIHHRVSPGETLQKISMRYFGTTRKWHAIFSQNHTVINSADAVEPGTVLTFEGPTTSAQSESNTEEPQEVVNNSDQPEEKPARRKPASHQADSCPCAHQHRSPAQAHERVEEYDENPYDNVGAPMVQPDYIRSQSR